MEAGAEVKENRYIPLSEVIAYLTDGWSVRPLSMPHGSYSALAWRVVSDD